MRQTIPFKKNLVLNNKFDNITSLTLEHDYLVDEDAVKGEFIINGTYHATEASLIDEDFYQKLPFEIALSDRIIKDSINLTIDDFSYNKVSDDTVTLLPLTLFISPLPYFLWLTFVPIFISEADFPYSAEYDLLLYLLFNTVASSSSR